MNSTIALPLSRVLPYSLVIQSVNPFYVGPVESRPENRPCNMMNFVEEFARFYNSLFSRNIPYNRWFPDNGESFYRHQDEINILHWGVSTDVNYIYNCMIQTVKDSALTWIQTCCREYQGLHIADIENSIEFKTFMSSYVETILIVMLYNYFPIVRPFVEEIFYFTENEEEHQYFSSNERFWVVRDYIETFLDMGYDSYDFLLRKSKND